MRRCSSPNPGDSHLERRGAVAFGRGAEPVQVNSRVETSNHSPPYSQAPAEAPHSPNPTQSQRHQCMLHTGQPTRMQGVCGMLNTSGTRHTLDWLLWLPKGEAASKRQSTFFFIYLNIVLQLQWYIQFIFNCGKKCGRWCMKRCVPVRVCMKSTWMSVCVWKTEQGRVRWEDVYLWQYMHAHEDVQVDVRLCKGQVFKVYLERCVGEDVCVCMSGKPWRVGARR